MRYTTVIDISEFPDIYQNKNIVLVYLHLCLKCGYHDEDRDVIRISIRRLASDLDLSISAIRHALRMLIQCHLLGRTDGGWVVTKWVSEKAVTKRSKEQDEREKAQRAAAQKRERDTILAAMSVDELRQWQTEILKGRPTTRHGLRISGQYHAWYQYIETVIDWKIKHNHCV